MEGGIVLIILIVLGAPLILAIWLIVRAVTANSEITELRLRLGNLEREVLRLRKEGVTGPESTPAESPAAKVVAAIEETKPVAPPPEPPSIAPQPPAFVPPPVLQPEPVAVSAPPQIQPEPVHAEASVPPPIAEKPQQPRAP